jgi:RNA polymerase sigma-70 factor (ECF subfamily)
MSASHNTDTETLLISQLKKGSSKAFDRLYRMYVKRLYAYCLQFTKSPEDSEEIVQDVFVKLWTDRERIRQEDTLCSLLFIMTKHHLISAFRSKINQPAYEEYMNCKETMSMDDAGQQLEYRDFIAKFKKALHTLPTTQQKVIVLSKMKAFSNKEIAEELALSEQTVKNSLSVGLKKLKEEMGKLYFLYILIFINLIGALVLLGG